MAIQLLLAGGSKCHISNQVRTAAADENANCYLTAS
jgi:hypothetical protein